MKLPWQITREITQTLIIRQQELLYYSVPYKIRSVFLTFPASVPNVTFEINIKSGVPFNENVYLIALIIMLNSTIYAYNVLSMTPASML